MKLVIAYQFLCDEHDEYDIQFAKLAVFKITIWKKLMFTLWNALYCINTFLQKSCYWNQIVIPYQFVCAEHESDSQIAKLALFF